MFPKRPCTNFILSNRVREIIDAFVPRSDEEIMGPVQLPYFAWALGGKEMNGETVVRTFGPGYTLGSIGPKQIDERIVIARDNGRSVAFALRDPYDPLATYLVDCVDRRFSIVALVA